MPVSSSARVFRAISQPASLAKAHVTAIADDDVVEDVHADQLSGVDQSSRERHIVRARRWIAARVIVRVMCPESLCGRGQWEPPITPVDTLIAAT